MIELFTSRYSQNQFDSELLKTANPTVLELLFLPEDCIIYKHPVFDILIKHRDKFLTKKCRD